MVVASFNSVALEFKAASKRGVRRTQRTNHESRLSLAFVTVCRIQRTSYESRLKCLEGSGYQPWIQIEVSGGFRGPAVNPDSTQNLIEPPRPARPWRCQGAFPCRQSAKVRRPVSALPCKARLWRVCYVNVPKFTV